MRIFNLFHLFEASNIVELLILLSLAGLLTILMTDRFLIFFSQKKKKINAKRYQSFKDSNMDTFHSLMIQETPVSMDYVQEVFGNKIQQLDRKSRDLVLHDIARIKRLNPEINVLNYMTLIRYVQKY